MSNKNQFKPNEQIMQIVGASDKPMTFAEISAQMEAINGVPFKATATVSAMVKHGYIADAGTVEIVCECCKSKRKVKTYAAIR